MSFPEKNEIIILIIAFVVASIFNYFLSGWLTTIIFRSDNKNEVFLLSGKCVCDYCGSKIPSIYTLPIIGIKLLHNKTKCCNKEINYYSKYELKFIIVETIILILFGLNPLICGIISFILSIFMLILDIKDMGIKEINKLNFILGCLSLLLCYIVYTASLAIWILLKNCI
jgi:hypothetical protein